MTRRDFMSATTLAGSALMLDTLQAKAKPLQPFKGKAGYQLLIFATNWGYTGTWDGFCRQTRDDGYDGAEFWMPSEKIQIDNIFGTIKSHGLKHGLLIGSGEITFEKNLAAFEKSLEEALLTKPFYINCHSGKDYFTFDENQRFIALTTKASKESGIPIYHETHRSRILFSAPTARQYMEKNPELRLTFDVSHWCTVHESLLSDQADTVAMALERTGHIHARIGHSEGPQVNDPRAPEWKEAVDAHFAWWDTIVKNRKAEGKTLTFLTEFGPPDYLPTLPYTRQPLADQREINLHMLKTLSSRYR